MSGLEVFAAFAALAPLISTSVKLIYDIKKRNKKKKEERAFLENELHTSLEQGELEIRETYMLYAERFGDPFRRGDHIARERFQYIIFEAKNIQRVLQLVWSVKQAVKNPEVYNPRELRETWNVTRFKAKQTMDDLSQRILASNPPFLPAIEPRPPAENQNTERNNASTIVYSTPQVEQPCTSARHTMSSLFLKEPVTSVTPLPQENLQEHRFVLDFRPSYPSLDIPAPSNPAATSDFIQPKRVSTISSDTADTGKSAGTTNTPQASITKSSTPASSVSHLSPSSQQAQPHKVAQKRSATGHIQGTGHRPPLVGRPEKSNNYHGFCKGAWTIQGDHKKGVRLQAHPNGILGQVWFWQCSECCFRSRPVLIGKKQYAIDDTVHCSESGVHFRWSFLAKSHQKCKDAPFPDEKTRAKMMAQNYGCAFCCAEGKYTESFGGVETLMNHIYEKHSSTSAVSADTLRRTNCVLGRKADRDEAFDINIPVSWDAAQDQVSLMDDPAPEMQLLDLTT